MREANNRTRYLFNGKELDNETNLYYYGARYFEPQIMTWYGVDLLTEKYPFNSSYVYCNANPVKYVDPDGRELLAFYATQANNETTEEEAKGNRILESGFYKAFAAHKNDNTICIAAHGNTKGIYPYGINPSYTPGLNGPILVGKFSSFLLEESEKYRQNLAEGKTSLIILFSCKTGSNGNIAEKVSRILDVMILAPTLDAHATPNRFHGVGTLRKKGEKKWVEPGGCWRLFYKGKVIATFDPRSVPEIGNPDEFVEKYKRQYIFREKGFFALLKYLLTGKSEFDQ